MIHMKRSALKPDEIYVLSGYGRYNPRYRLDKVRVVSPDALKDRGFYSRSGATTVTAWDDTAVEVPARYVRDSRGQFVLVENVTSGHQSVVALTKVACMVAEHEENMAACAVDDAAADRARDERYARAVSAEAYVEEVLGDRAEEFMRPAWRANMFNEGDHRFTSVNLAALVRAAYEAGRASTEKG
jgi:hypothetical protein